MIEFNSDNLSINENDKILVAVSGGPDSMALLDRLRRLSEEVPFELGAAHVNYHLRKESDDEQEGVRRYCERYDIPLYIREVESNEFSKSRRSVEETARDIRYAFFDELAKEHQYTTLMTAHHLNDQAETILMRLLRGTGPEGADGIKSQSKRKDLKMIRPFLSENKVNLRKYCDENAIEYFIDTSNDENLYARNTIRNMIFPQLEEIFPRAQENLVKFAELLSQENRIISDITKHLERQYTEESEWGILISKELFDRSDDPFERTGLSFLSGDSRHFILTELIRDLLKRLGGLKDQAKKHVDEILDFFESDKNGEIHLPGQILVLKSGNTYLITKRDRLPRDFGEYPIDIPKESDKKRVFLFPKENKKLIVRTGRAQDFKTHFKSPNQALLKMKDLEDLKFRKRLKDDEVFLSGMSTKKKLSRYMIDKKIPQFQRDNLPVLASRDSILWIPGYYIHRDFLVHSPEDTVVELTYLNMDDYEQE